MLAPIAGAPLCARAVLARLHTQALPFHHRTQGLAHRSRAHLRHASMPRRSDEGVELSDGRVIEPETATEGSEFVKDQKTNIAAELQAGGGPVNGWESIWAAGLQPGQVTTRPPEHFTERLPGLPVLWSPQGHTRNRAEMHDWGARCGSVEVVHVVAHVHAMTPRHSSQMWRSTNFDSSRILGCGEPPHCNTQAVNPPICPDMH